MENELKATTGLLIFSSGDSTRRAITKFSVVEVSLDFTTVYVYLTNNRRLRFEYSWGRIPMYYSKYGYSESPGNLEGKKIDEVKSTCTHAAEVLHEVILKHMMDTATTEINLADIAEMSIRREYMPWIHVINDSEAI
jgi:hypothetical protein